MKKTFMSYMGKLFLSMKNFFISPSEFSFVIVSEKVMNSKKSFLVSIKIFNDLFQLSSHDSIEGNVSNETILSQQLLKVSLEFSYKNFADFIFELHHIFKKF